MTLIHILLAKLNLAKTVQIDCQFEVTFRFLLLFSPTLGRSLSLHLSYYCLPRESTPVGLIKRFLMMWNYMHAVRSVSMLELNETKKERQKDREKEKWHQDWRVINDETNLYGSIELEREYNEANRMKQIVYGNEIESVLHFWFVFQCSIHLCMFTHKTDYSYLCACLQACLFIVSHATVFYCQFYTHFMVSNYFWWV